MTAKLPLLALCCAVAVAGPVEAGDDPGPGYVGGLVGVSTLSADGRTVVATPVARASLATPENGPALTGVVGLHVHRFVSVQASYIWNRNDLTLFSSVTSPGGGGFSEQERSSAQSTLVADLLVYVRGLDSRVRPYLSIGAGVVRVASDPPSRTTGGGLEATTGPIGSTRAGLRVAVGIDLAVGGGWSIRYTFSETISSNPISEQLVPPGQRSLANFQSLVGIVRRL